MNNFLKLELNNIGVRYTFKILIVITFSGLNRDAENRKV
jgi:hypothetical protein